jgi:hypothetical protein
LPPFAYADLQVLGAAVEGVGSLDQAKLAAYLRSHTFHTLVGDITFGPNGEWTEPRVLAAQFQGVQRPRRRAVQGYEDRGHPVAAGTEIRRAARALQRREALMTRSIGHTKCAPHGA